MPDIRIKRIYEAPETEDGKRILIDRLWPRGMTKEKARIDIWAREIAPSHELRKWYQHEHQKWDTFRKRYYEELRNQSSIIDKILSLAAESTITLVFSSKESEKNNAVALKQYLEKKR